MLVEGEGVGRRRWLYALVVVVVEGVRLLVGRLLSLALLCSRAVRR